MQEFANQRRVLAHLESRFRQQQRIVSLLEWAEKDFSPSLLAACSQVHHSLKSEIDKVNYTPEFIFGGDKISIADIVKELPPKEAALQRFRLPGQVLSFIPKPKFPNEEFIGPPIIVFPVAMTDFNDYFWWTELNDQQGTIAKITWVSPEAHRLNLETAQYFDTKSLSENEPGLNVPPDTFFTAETKFDWAFERLPNLTNAMARKIFGHIASKAALLTSDKFSESDIQMALDRARKAF